MSEVPLYFLGEAGLPVLRLSRALQWSQWRRGGGLLLNEVPLYQCLSGHRSREECV